MGELEAKRNALKHEILNAEVVAEGYSKLPHLLDEAERAGAREVSPDVLVIARARGGATELRSVTRES